MIKKIYLNNYNSSKSSLQARDTTHAWRKSGNSRTPQVHAHATRKNRNAGKQ